MAYVLVLDSGTRSARSPRFTKTVPRSVDPKTGRARVCWIFLTRGEQQPRLSNIGHVAKPYGESVATDERRILVEHVRPTEDPVTLQELGRAMETLHFNRLLAAIEDQAQVLSPGASQALQAAVIELRPRLRQRLEWLKRIGSPERFVRGTAGLRGPNRKISGRGVASR
jgi:hypothetical protein